MIRNICLATIFVLLSVATFAQSGRMKPTETATPRPKPVYNPTEIGEGETSKTPDTATPQKNEDDSDVIKVDSTLVPIPVSVIDSSGHSVTNLKLEDFLLQIDGKPAAIGELFRATSPVRLALLFDNSGSVAEAREFEKEAAIGFLKQVIRPNRDQAALYSVATIARLEQPLTPYPAQLIGAIENLEKPEGATALLDGILNAANYLRGYQGRRVIVVVSDGEDTLSNATLDGVVKAVQMANCQVYVVKTTDFENLLRTGSRAGNANIRTLTAERRMQEIANATGGAVYSPVGEVELNQAFTQISAELAEQYILAYYPENSEERGSFKTINLTVKNHGDLTIRTRKGYVVPKRR